MDQNNTKINMDENNKIWDRMKIYEKLAIFSAILLTFFVGMSVYFYTKSRDMGPDSSGKNTETLKVINDLGKIILLPEGEDPTIATISDVEKVNNQPFFNKAKNGDRVLIYVKAKKAYLYRPSENKLVEVAPLTE